MADLRLARRIENRVWKEHMEKTMKKENAWGQNTRDWYSGRGFLKRK